MNKKKCIRCENEISTKMRVCPFCNMPNKMPATKKIAKCPKCQVELISKTYNKIQLETCHQCNGIWLDTLDFETLTSPKDVYSDSSTNPIFIKEPLEEKSPYCECIRCNNMMSRVNFKSISGILIDICCDHGVWLDDKELDRLRNFIASGGYYKEHEMKINKNADKIGKLTSNLSNVEFMQRALHRWDLRRILNSGGITK